MRKLTRFRIASPPADADLKCGCIASTGPRLVLGRTGVHEAIGATARDPETAASSMILSWHIAKTFALKGAF